MLAALLVTGAVARAGTPGQTEFEAATTLESKGDYAGAANALEALARARPDDAFADDALFEAAVVCEERLNDPARAARLYEQVATRYASSRLARRARTRADFLSSSLKSGEAPLREYQDLMNGFSKRPPAESIARMAQLVDGHPDFALSDRALYWLGATLVEQRRPDEGLARFLEVERRFPDSEWSSRAKKARGDLALRRHQYSEARAIYQELARKPDLISRAASKEGLANVGTSEGRGLALVLSLAYLALFLGAHLWALRRITPRLRMPVELLFYLPVAALFTLAGLTENSSIALATAGIAVGGALVVWTSGVVTDARLAESPLPLRARLGRICATGAAVLCVAYVAIQATGLTDLVFETIRNGPDR